MERTQCDGHAVIIFLAMPTDSDYAAVGCRMLVRYVGIGCALSSIGFVVILIIFVGRALKLWT